ncbi:hypothetical protein BH09BAC3_BH09BAC3_21040 [soil metagenome]
MRSIRPKLLSLIILSGLFVISSCSKNDPVPLGAQKNATLLAGDAGKSKAWKLTQLTFQTGSAAAQTANIPACYLDNIYTFTNNAAQDYVGTEGVTFCDTSQPSTIETGTWAFTLDGLMVTIAVDETFSPFGLFSPEVASDSNGDPLPYNIGYPFPAIVKTLTATSMVLEMNETLGTTKYKYVFTFVAS